MGDDAVDNGILLVGVGPKVDYLTPDRLSKDSDLLRITTKRSNIIANPFDPNALIAETEVGRLAWGSREAEDVNSIVNRNNDILRTRKILTVVESSVSASIVESSSARVSMAAFVKGFTFPAAKTSFTLG